MLTRPELKHIARARLADAVALHGRRRLDGAVYICGYAAELALKARICQTLSWEGYPETRAEFQNYASFRTHDLAVLLRLSGVRKRILLDYRRAWSVVSEWTPEKRYQRIGGVLRADSEAMIKASRSLLKTL